MSVISCWWVLMYSVSNTSGIFHTRAAAQLQSYHVNVLSIEVSPKRRRHEGRTLSLIASSHWLKSDIRGFTLVTEVKSFVVIVRMVVLRIEREWELWNSFFYEQYNLMWSTFHFPPSKMRGEDMELNWNIYWWNTKYPEKVTWRKLKEPTWVWFSDLFQASSHLLHRIHICSINRDLVSDAQWCVTKPTIHRNSLFSQSEGPKWSNQRHPLYCYHTQRMSEVTAHFAPLPPSSAPPPALIRPLTPAPGPVSRSLPADTHHQPPGEIRRTEEWSTGM